MWTVYSAKFGFLLWHVAHRMPLHIRERRRAAELLQRPVDVLVAGGPPAIRAAQQATGTIPIVMAGGGDPVAAGWIASLAQPGGGTSRA
jgi:ABC-type uncharacterized transport system substrate-binding protein